MFDEICWVGKYIKDALNKSTANVSFGIRHTLDNLLY